MTIETLGIDIAKNIVQFHVVGLTAAPWRSKRARVLFYCARKFEGLGHQVRIISPQYVKPFVRRQKNEGIGSAN
jgi:transposase